MSLLITLKNSFKQTSKIYTFKNKLGSNSIKSLLSNERIGLKFTIEDFPKIELITADIYALEENLNYLVSTDSSLEKIVFNLVNLASLEDEKFELKTKDLLQEAKLPGLFNLISSTIIGAYLGDSLGSYYEFKMGGDLYNDKIVFIDKNPIFGTSPGQLTDDSEMACSLGYGIIDNIGNFNINRIGYYYYHWYLTNPYDIGNTTSKALISLNKEIYINDYFVETLLKATQNSTSLSNGFLMRKTPLAAYCCLLIDFEKIKNMTLKDLGNDHHLSEESLNYLKIVTEYDTRMTHYHEETLNASELYVLMITRIVYLRFINVEKSQIAENVLEYACTYINSIKNKESGLKNMLSIAKGDLSIFNYKSFSKNMGWYILAMSVCFRSLYFLSLKKDTSYIDEIKFAINLGGDTDTNAAILGGIIGPIFGIETFPDELVTKLVTCNPLLSDIRRPFIYSGVNGLLKAKIISEYKNRLDTSKNGIISNDSSFKYLSYLLNYLNK